MALFCGNENYCQEQNGVAKAVSTIVVIFIDPLRYSTSNSNVIVVYISVSLKMVLRDNANLDRH